MPSVSSTPVEDYSELMLQPFDFSCLDDNAVLDTSADRAAANDGGSRLTDLDLLDDEGNNGFSNGWSAFAGESNENLWSDGVMATLSGAIDPQLCEEMAYPQVSVNQLDCRLNDISETLSPPSEPLHDHNGNLNFPHSTASATHNPSAPFMQHHPPLPQYSIFPSFDYFSTPQPCAVSDSASESRFQFPLHRPPQHVQDPQAQLLAQHTPPFPVPYVFGSYPYTQPNTRLPIGRSDRHVSLLPQRPSCPPPMPFNPQLLWVDPEAWRRSHERVLSILQSSPDYTPSTSYPTSALDNGTPPSPDDHTPYGQRVADHPSPSSSDTSSSFTSDSSCSGSSCSIDSYQYTWALAAHSGNASSSSSVDVSATASFNVPSKRPHPEIYAAPAHPVEAPLFRCQWGDQCGEAVPRTNADWRLHLRLRHDKDLRCVRGKSKEQRTETYVVCRWPGCREHREMNFASIGRHVCVTHLRAGSLPCRYCGSQLSRGDSLRRHEKKCKEEMEAAEAARALEVSLAAAEGFVPVRSLTPNPPR